MNNVQITAVTPPDDIVLQAPRLLCIDLSAQQSEFVSNTLKDTTKDCVVYIWNKDADVDWLFDKAFKSTIIIINSESDCQDIVGWMLSMKQSYYLGQLKNLSLLNNKAIYSSQQILDLIEEY